MIALLLLAILITLLGVWAVVPAVLVGTVVVLAALTVYCAPFYVVYGWVERRAGRRRDRAGLPPEVTP